MNEKYLTPTEREEMITSFRRLLEHTRDIVEPDDIKRVRHIINEGICQNHYRRDKYDINSALTI